MAPALLDGDVVVVRRASKAGVGDIVLVRWAQRPGQLSVKRVAEPLQVGSGYVVLGDNMFASTDSRQLGPAEVLGVVLFRLSRGQPRNVA